MGIRDEEPADVAGAREPGGESKPPSAGVLPVSAVEVLRNGRLVRPIPVLSTLPSEHVGWDGIALEAYSHVPACVIPDHDHPTHFLNLLTSAPVEAEWTSDGRTRSGVNDPGTIYLLRRYAVHPPKTVEYRGGLPKYRKRVLCPTY
jgi:hypothetical protein